mgnify:CR=1 FL=1|jgi:hypothetical protein
MNFVKLNKNVKDLKGLVKKAGKPRIGKAIVVGH